jgi:hypothetical protein
MGKPAAWFAPWGGVQNVRRAGEGSVKIEFRSHRQCPMISYVTGTFALVPSRSKQGKRLCFLRLSALLAQQGNMEQGASKRAFRLTCPTGQM